MNSLWMGLVVAVLVVLIAKVVLGGAGADKAVVREKIKGGAMVVDVRTPGEYAGGHYEGATNIPLQELGGRLKQLGAKDRVIVVYCASGMRSAQAAKILVGAGYKDVTNAGGLQNLERGQ